MLEEISYKLEKFEGPLDLLLHLIEKGKMDIYDIPIVDITAQYLHYVETMEEDNLDTKSEFLVMAATLLDIKAKMLLPKEINEETGKEIDPREELVERLLEHKRYCQLAKELANQEFFAQRNLYKEPTIPNEVLQYESPVDLDALFGDMNLAKLKEIFDGVMRRSDSRMDKQRSKFGTIKRERISLEEKVSSVLKYARRRRNFSFKDLLERQKNKLEVVVTFLAVLELMKVGAICLKQEETFGDMVIESKTEKNTDKDIKEMEDLGIPLTGLRESK